MQGATGDLRGSVEQDLWPVVEEIMGSHHLAGLAVAVVREGEVVSRGFGVRDVATGAPVTPETMFHLASVSKPFVATAVVAQALAPDGRGTAFDLDAPIVEWIPEFTLADARAAEVTARHLLSHTSGLPDVTDYGWHDPQLGDDALSEFARSLSGWRLQTDPGSTFSYSNAGFELLGLLLSRITGTTFENAVKEYLLSPLGMRDSTFLRSDVPVELAASPHVGVPLSVPEGAYPYTRRHAPSSTLHSNLVELCRWVEAHLEPGLLDPRVVEATRQPAVAVDDPTEEIEAALGWFVGSDAGHRTLSHSGADPGFRSKLVLVPDRRVAVVVLANSNTAPTGDVAAAGLDLALADEPGEGVAALRALLPPVASLMADSLATPGAAVAEYHRLAAIEPARANLDDGEFTEAVWGAIELHRTELVWPLLRVWTELRPDSSEAWTMTGWAHQVDGRLDLARSLLERAIELDPDNEDATLIMSGLPPV